MSQSIPLSMHIRLEHEVRAAAPVDYDVPPSSNVLEVAAMFGLGVDQTRRLKLVPPTAIELRPHQLVFLTGPSGSGKSTVLRLMAEAVGAQAGARAVRFDALSDPPARPLVDGFQPVGDKPGDPVEEPPLEKVLRWLSLAGLNDAFVMLRRPSELSDGQRYRLRLAQAMAAAEVEAGRLHDVANRPVLPVVLADEFGATLDRATAAAVARNVRKWVNRTPVCFVAATTHDDLLEPFEPDVLIEKHLGCGIEVVERKDNGASFTNC